MNRAQRAELRRAQPYWTPGFLAFVLPLTAEQVLQRATQADSGVTLASRREWTWVQTAQRLTWMYGASAALERLNTYPEPSSTPNPGASR